MGSRAHLCDGFVTVVATVEHVLTSEGFSLTQSEGAFSRSRGGFVDRIKLLVDYRTAAPGPSSRSVPAAGVSVCTANIVVEAADILVGGLATNVITRNIGYLMSRSEWHEWSFTAETVATTATSVAEAIRRHGLAWIGRIDSEEAFRQELRRHTSVHRALRQPIWMRRSQSA